MPLCQNRVTNAESAAVAHDGELWMFDRNGTVLRCVPFDGSHRERRSSISMDIQIFRVNLIPMSAQVVLPWIAQLRASDGA